MPRNGSNIYTYPAGTEGFPDTTIESEKYNNYILDVQEDLNRPRPIVAGGTGANSADGALINLSAEKANQSVSNFNTHTWMSGSFNSNTSAIGSPVDGHAFAGIVYKTSSGDFAVEARDASTGFVYTRVQSGGVWSLWGRTDAPLTCADDPPTGFAAMDNSLWFESSTGLLYVRYNDGDSSQWCIACPQPDISSYAFKTDVVAKAGDTMTGALILPATDPTLDLEAVNKKYVDERTFAAAVPVEAFVYGGLQVNGSFDVSQENGSTARTTQGYVCDGWQFFLSGSMAVSAARLSGSLGNFLSVTTTTPQPTLGANDYLIVTQRIEGYHVARLLWGAATASPITISFQTSHSKAGLYSVSIRNGGTSDRVYAATYTQGAANVVQAHSVTIPGDITGTWAKGNTTGIEINFGVAAGSSRMTAANAWSGLGGFVFTATGQVNCVSSTSDIFRLSYVTVLPGDEAPLTVRPYDKELSLCQRYFWQVPDKSSFSGFAGAATVAFGTLKLEVAMRAAPTMSFPSAVGAYQVGTLLTAVASDFLPAGLPNYTSTNTVGLQFNTPASLTAGQGVVMFLSGGVINLSARL